MRGILYTNPMFSQSFCAAGCGRPAFTGSALCAVHSTDSKADALRLSEYITKQKVIKDISAQGLHFEQVDFSQRKYYGCNFSGASFHKCIFSGVLMRLTFFDFSTLSHCDFSKGDLQFLSLAGAVIEDCSFEGSELININFEGTQITGSSFNNSNLFHSRFIGAGITRTGFIDCNLKWANFTKTKREDVSFKSSNTAEAIFEMEEYK